MLNTAKILICFLFIFFTMSSAIQAETKTSKKTKVTSAPKATSKPVSKTTKSTITPKPTATPAAYTFTQLKLDFEEWVKKNSIPAILKQVEKDLSEETKKDTLNFVIKHRSELIAAKDDAVLKQQLIDKFYQEMLLVDEFVHVKVKEQFFKHMTTLWMDYITKQLVEKKVPRATQKPWLNYMIKYFVTFKDGVADEMMKGFDVSFDPKTIAELSINDIVSALSQK